MSDGPSAETDKNGAFTINDIPEGAQCRFLAEAEGYTLSWSEDMAVPAKNVTIKLVPESRIRGWLKDEKSGAPVSGVRFVLRGRQEDFLAGPTDAQGRFDVGRLGPGQYLVGDDLWNKDPRGVLARVAPIQLSLGQPLENLVLNWAEGVVLAGKVLNEAGHPVVGARVQQGSFAGATDNKGQIDLPAQRFRNAEDKFDPVFIVSAAGDLGAVLEPRAGGGKELTVALKKTATLTGLVMKPDGSPLKGARAQACRVANDSNDPTGTPVETDAAARYRITGMIGGVAYAVQAKADGYAPNDCLKMKKTTPEASAVVEMEPLTLDAAVAPAGQATEHPAAQAPILALSTLKVVDEAGNPVAKAAVEQWVNDAGDPLYAERHSFNGVTDEKGQVSLPPQRTEGDGAIAPILIVSESGDLGAFLDPRATSGKEAKVTIRKTATLTGVVKKPDGAPLEGAEVQAWWMTDRLGQFRGAPVKTDAAGRYKITGVIAGGSYVTVASADGYGRNDYATMKTAAPDPGAVVEMEPITLGIAGAVLKGRVTNTAGEPVPNMFILLNSRRNDSRPATTDKDGRFTFEKLIPEEVMLCNMLSPKGSQFYRTVAPADFGDVQIVIRPEIGQ